MQKEDCEGTPCRLWQAGPSGCAVAVMLWSCVLLWAACVGEWVLQQHVCMNMYTSVCVIQQAASWLLHSAVSTTQTHAHQFGTPVPVLLLCQKDNCTLYMPCASLHLC